MAAAYLYAERRGPMPPDLQLANAVSRYGVQAIFGRVLGAGELRRMLACENIVRAYQERQKHPNWAEWARDNPDESRILNQLAKATAEIDYGE